jgi:hypothetical protein
MKKNMPSHDMVWLVIEPTPLKNIKVSWDDDIPNIWKKNHVPKHQPVVGFPMYPYQFGL